MSWAVEEWKDGLPGKALQKIQEMEVQLDKLKKERTQKQFQLDSLEAALQKQKQKCGSVWHWDGAVNCPGCTLHLLYSSWDWLSKPAHNEWNIDGHFT
uniref:Centromere protein Cenp-F N-terminal domain-containing protein n=1 Tax=Oryzias sinensis TaxID=183150 RepID=A0A8C8DJG3_9TELE